ncbi:hypothetical protein [Streptomyces sp. NPDC005322]|uniref:hypothetical protein n=1 Tax=Streptomyces sp. NPDC005322 TaxID=3157032 RepID=UPI0033AAB448
MQIPSQYAQPGRLAGLGLLLVLSLVGGVGPQKIVELEAVKRGLCQQMGADQDVE